jgi:hypothetical protein
VRKVVEVVVEVWRGTGLRNRASAGRVTLNLVSSVATLASEPSSESSIRLCPHVNSVRPPSDEVFGRGRWLRRIRMVQSPSGNPTTTGGARPASGSLFTGALRASSSYPRRNTSGESRQRQARQLLSILGALLFARPALRFLLAVYNFSVGTMPAEDSVISVHSPDFILNEDGMKYGVKTFCYLVWDYTEYNLARKSK